MHVPAARFHLTALVAALMLTACSGAEDAPDDTVGAGGQAAGIEVVSGDLFYEPESLTATAGEVTISLDNQGSAVHNVIVEEAGDAKVVEAEGGATDTGTIQLEAGTYTFYCDIVGHREAGMEGTLTVSE